MCAQLIVSLSFAYAAARRYVEDLRFAFGTWKIEVLGSFASAIFLLGVAAMMVVALVERIFSPQPIHYQEAIVVAVLGLAVNLVWVARRQAQLFVRDQRGHARQRPHRRARARTTGAARRDRARHHRDSMRPGDGRGRRLIRGMR